MAECSAIRGTQIYLGGLPMRLHRHTTKNQYYYAGMVELECDEYNPIVSRGAAATYF